MAATILHADVDAFFASVEQRDDPRLRGRPTVVGVGVVMAASYEARAFGIRGGMPGGEARRRCPDLIEVHPHFDAYLEASRALFDIFERTAPVVEGLSLEEAFLEVGGLERIAGSPERIATRLRREIREGVGLPITVGIARTKVLAKMASRAAKPDGLLLVRPDREREFLHPQPVGRIWGVGPSTAAKLHTLGIETVGDLAALPELSLIELLGTSTGRKLHSLAHFREPAPVRARPGRRSFGSQSALGRGRRSPEELDAILSRLVERVTRRMRDGGRAGRTVVLRLRFGDYTRATRSTTLSRATAATAAVVLPARRLLAGAQPLIGRRGITLIGVAVTSLDPRGTGVQLELPLGRARGEALDDALDNLRERFGADSVTRGPPRNEPQSLAETRRSVS